MNVVSSPTIRASLKKIRVFLIFGFFFLAVAIGLGAWAYMLSMEQSDAINLNSLIIDKVKESKFAKVEVASVPYAFAEYDNTTEKYYFVFDQEDLMYVVYLPRDVYYKLDNETILENPMVIEGMTKPIPEDIRKLAIEVYNEANEEEFLTDENFENYLGSIYLDVTEKPNNNTAQLIFAIVSGVFSLLFIFLSFFMRIRSKKVVRKFSEEEWKKIESELESSETISYKSLNLHFTENYIVVLSSGIDIFSYKDILWIYPFIQRINGIKASQSLMVLTNDAKTHRIAEIDIITKKKKEVYEEIWNTIINRNPNMLTGYTKENIAIMNDKIKEIKEERKNNK